MLIGGTGIGFFVWNEWNNLSVSSIITAILVIGVVGLCSIGCSTASRLSRSANDARLSLENIVKSYPGKREQRSVDRIRSQSRPRNSSLVGRQVAEEHAFEHRGRAAAADAGRPGGWRRSRVRARPRRRLPAPCVVAVDDGPRKLAPAPRSARRMTGRQRVDAAIDAMLQPFTYACGRLFATPFRG